MAFQPTASEDPGNGREERRYGEESRLLISAPATTTTNFLLDRSSLGSDCNDDGTLQRTTTASPADLGPGPDPAQQEQDHARDPDFFPLLDSGDSSSPTSPTSTFASAYPASLSAPGGPASAYYYSYLSNTSTAATTNANNNHSPRSPRHHQANLNSQRRRPRDLGRLSFLSLSRSSMSSNPTTPGMVTAFSDAASSVPATASTLNASVPGEGAPAFVPTSDRHPVPAVVAYQRHQKQLSEPVAEHHRDYHAREEEEEEGEDEGNDQQFLRHHGQPGQQQRPQHQQRRSQKQQQQRPYHHWSSSSKSHLSKYLKGRLTPDHDGPGRRSLDSFADRRKQQQQQQRRQQQQQQQQRPWDRRYSLKLPIMSMSTATTTPVSPIISQDEFEALPATVQRKYFSTLERLRIAQTSSSRHHNRHDSDLSDHVDPLRCHSPLISSCPPTPLERPFRHARFASDFVTGGGVGPDSYRAHPVSPDFLARLPEKIQRLHLTSEEQFILAKHRRQRVILDSADEVVFRRRFAPELFGNPVESANATTRRPASAGTMSVAATATTRATMTTTTTITPDMDTAVPAGPRDSIYDTFRWLDDDEDIDLRLYLDDYHANLREELPQSSKSRRPSFRRHMSISKLPFGGNGKMSSLAPATTSGAPLPAPSRSSPPTPSPIIPAPAPPPRRRSRTLSLITPKHTAAIPPPDDIAAPEGPAAHYRDPDARLKLRVYLASPQKFDEAIEFGFPSTDALSTTRTDLSSSAGWPSRQLVRGHEDVEDAGDDDDNAPRYGAHTFLADDQSSIYSNEDGSVADPESPKTPHTFEDEHPPATPRPVRAFTEPSGSSSSCSRKGSCDYMRAPASSREMTLRMTLTRPDLRADDEQIYGWQKNTQRKKSHSSPLRDEMVSPGPPDPANQLATMNQLEGGHSGEGGVIRRIWKKVRRQ